jgi:hypothetical protein
MKTDIRIKAVENTPKIFTFILTRNTQTVHQVKVKANSLSKAQKLAEEFGEKGMPNFLPFGTKEYITEAKPLSENKSWECNLFSPT